MQSPHCYPVGRIITEVTTFDRGDESTGSAPLATPGIDVFPIGRAAKRMSMFIVVRRNTDSAANDITHAWGPYPTREHAESVKADFGDWPMEGEFELMPLNSYRADNGRR